MTDFVWKQDNGSSTTWSRSLHGCDTITALMNQQGKGQQDVCVGLVFSTPLNQNELKARLEKAWTLTRFRFPILAAHLIHDSAEKDQIKAYKFQYRQGAAKDEASAAFHVFEGREGGDDVMEEARLAHGIITEKASQDGVSLHLLKSQGSQHAIFLYGSHAHLDIRATFYTFNYLFEQVASDKLNTDALQAGAEIPNLTPSLPVCLPSNTPYESNDKIGQFIGDQLGQAGELMPVTPTLAADGPIGTGSVVPIRQILSQEATQAILAKLKEKGYTATHAFDAALQIAIAEQGDNVPTDGWKGRKSMVFPISIDSRRWFKPEYRDDWVGQAITGMSLRLDLSPLSDSKTTKDAMWALMQQIKTQYTDALKDPTMAYAIHPMMSALGLADGLPPASPRSVHCFESAGVIENTLKVKFGDSIVVTDDVHVSLRLSYNVVPIFHLWTFGGRMHFQMNTPPSLAYCASQICHKVVTLVQSLV